MSSAADIADTREMSNTNVSLFQRIKSIPGIISVEPVPFLFFMGTMISNLASQTLSIEKTCRVNLKLPDVVCDALRNQDSDEYSEYERIVQQYIAKYNMYKSLIISVLPCLLLVFAGGWMDVTGRRKAIMLLPAFGLILNDMNSIFNVIFFDQLNVQYQIFSDAVISSIFGGFNILILAVFSYITDITTEKNRTHRLGLVSFGVTIGMPIGMALSGFLLDRYGYLAVYITSLTLSCINGVYILFRLKEPPRTEKHMEHDNRGFIYFLKTFFSPAHFLNSLRVVFMKAPNNRRVILGLLIVTACLVLGPAHGEAAVMYISTRYRFNWDEVQFSIFQTFNMVITTIGILISILLFSKKLGWHDSVLGIISTLSKVAASFLYGFANTGTAFFFGPMVDMLNGTSTIAIRAILSKTVESHEISRLNSIVGIAEVLMPLVYMPLYLQVYTNTMELLPGMVFLVGGAITVPPLLVFIWLFYRHRRNTNIEIIYKMDPELSS